MPNDPEFTTLLAAVDAIGKLADAHDTATDHCADHPCWENRYYTVALVMERLELTIGDVGFVAEKLLELECEVEAEVSSDNVLDAKEIE